jgi:hypothetical protein
MNFKLNQARLPRCTVSYGVGEIGGAVAYGVMAAAAVASTVVSIKSAQAQADAQRDAARYQAAVAANNQTIANSNAALTEAEGRIKEGAVREKTAQEMGGILAAEGASGVDTGFGTAVRLQEDTARLGETDALTTRNIYHNKAIAFENQASAFAGEIGMDNSAAEYATKAGYLSQAGSLASGVSSVASKWDKWAPSSPSTPAATSFSAPDKGKFSESWT